MYKHYIISISISMSIKKIVRAKEQYSNLFTPKVVFVDKYEETKRDSTRW